MPPEIKGFIQTTLIDWPGKIASEVFLAGCNFRCPYCHSRHLVVTPQELEAIPLDAVLGYLENNTGWVDGVVVSGGEPTLNQDLATLLKEFIQLGFKVKLDTNGTQPDFLAELSHAGLIHYVAMDIKAPLDERYFRACGVECDLEAISRSINFLLQDELDYEFRTTVCPAFVERKDISDIVRGIEGARRYTLQNFRPVNCLDPKMEQVKSFSKEVLQEMASQARQFVGEVSVRGEAPSASA
jgi:pyruvate formate lyase activating enzyme